MRIVKNDYCKNFSVVECATKIQDNYLVSIYVLQSYEGTIDESRYRPI